MKEASFSYIKNCGGTLAHILIIDDEELVCRALNKFLSGLGYKITTAYNGNIGIDLWNQLDIDLVGCFKCFDFGFVLCNNSCIKQY
jgi:PleD family two-component response regulator